MIQNYSFFKWDLFKAYRFMKYNTFKLLKCFFIFIFQNMMKSNELKEMVVVYICSPMCCSYYITVKWLVPTEDHNVLISRKFWLVLEGEHNFIDTM